MARRSFVQVNGKLYERGVDEIPDMDDGRPRGAAIIGDITPFVSSVDGSIISSRRDLRNHNARNNVVNTADLAGLPMKTMNQNAAPSQQHREETKRTIAEIINSRNYH